MVPGRTGVRVAFLQLLKCSIISSKKLYEHLCKLRTACNQTNKNIRTYMYWLHYTTLHTHTHIHTRTHTHTDTDRQTDRQLLHTHTTHMDTDRQTHITSTHLTKKLQFRNPSKGASIPSLIHLPPPDLPILMQFMM